MSAKGAAGTVKRREWMEILRGLTWLTQVGLSFAVPVVLCLLGANWLCDRFSVGAWIYLPAVVLGLGAGAASFASFARAAASHARKTQKRPPDRP